MACPAGLSFCAHPLHLRWRAVGFLLGLVVAAGGPCQLAAQDDPRELVLTTGNSAPARLTGVDEDFSLRFEIAGAARKFPHGDVVRWGEPSSRAPRHMLVLLRDGSQLVALVRELRGGTMVLDSYLFGELKIPRDAVRAVLLFPPAEVDARDELIGQLAAAPAEGDRLLFENDDGLAGEISELVEEDNPGGFGKRQVVRVDTGAGDTAIDTVLVRAIVLGEPRVSTAGSRPARALVGFNDGTLLHARSLRVTANEITLLPAVLGSRFAKSWSTDLIDSLVFLQPLGGRAVYLSDLPSAAYKHVPFLDLEWPLAQDTNVLGFPLRSPDGTLYPKGIGMHSAAVAAWVLAKPYRKLEAKLCLDARAGDSGSAVFRVLVDGETRYSSPEIRGGQSPVPISVDVTGARQLRLLISYGDRGDTRDYANWLDVRLVE